MTVKGKETPGIVSSAPFQGCQMMFWGRAPVACTQCLGAKERSRSGCRTVEPGGSCSSPVLFCNPVGGKMFPLAVVGISLLGTFV